ncbi:hypothetical protein C8J57DRAFT_1722098 [Mycena rebaudengoi]|nr:hypothetical protein C8J57DRAFT_1722098 [Mycena rebaudengoi]
MRNCILSPRFFRHLSSIDLRGTSSTPFMDAVQLQTQLNANYYFNSASFTILFYEYFLTLDREVSRFWGTAFTFTWANMLFFANRYGTLICREYSRRRPIFLDHPQHAWENCGDVRCLHLELYHQYFVIVTQILVAAMLILRTYALYEHNKRLLAVMLIITSVVIIVGLWAVIAGKGVDTSNNLPLYIGCNYPVGQPQGISQASAWAGVAVFDCMIFFLTLNKVFHRHRDGMGLITVLLRDGSVYFGVMVISEVSNILTLVLGSPYTRGFATTFTSIISSIMISRLMLNLRDPALAHQSGRHSRGTTTRMGTHDIRFVAPPDVPQLDTDASTNTDVRFGTT